MDKYLLSQIVVIIATIFIGLTYFYKDRKKILKLFMVYSLFYGIHYLLLGAITGFFMNLVSIIRNIVLLNLEKNKCEIDKKFILVLFSIIIVFTIYSYKDIFSIILMFASLISTYSICQKNHKIYKILAVIVSLCFILYAVHIKSLFAIITEIALLIAEIVGLVLVVIQKEIKKE